MSGTFVGAPGLVQVMFGQGDGYGMSVASIGYGNKPAMPLPGDGWGSVANRWDAVLTGKGGSVATDRNRCINYALEQCETLKRRLKKHVRNNADVNDLMQDTLLRILTSDLPPEGSIGSVGAFVWTMAKNAARDGERQEERRAAAHAALGVLEDPFNHGWLDKDLQVRQELSALYRAYRWLPRYLREVLRLRKVDGLSQQEIATRKRISERSVESYVRDAMDKLEQQLTTELDPVERQSVLSWLRRRMSRD